MIPIKPLNQTGKNMNPMPEQSLNRRPRKSSTRAESTAHTSSHSARTENESVHYHARHFGGRQSSARITDQLNPDRSVSLANKTGRSFPGL